jgi:hypothetical protein
VAGVSRCGREGAGEEWQAAGMLPVRASGHVTSRNREFLQLPLPPESIVAGP